VVLALDRSSMQIAVRTGHEVLIDRDRENPLCFGLSDHAS
jgi:hypothetical protein